MSNLSENPFSVQSPESMTAQETVDLFVDVFTDFYKVRSGGHTFVHGARGSGKSMMFRYLQPDSQCIANKCSVEELPFYGVHVPIKTTDLKLTELARLLDNNANVLLNEHFMCIYIAGRVFRSMEMLTLLRQVADAAELNDFLQRGLIPLLVQSGWENNVALDKVEVTVERTIDQLQDITNQVYISIITYLKRLVYAPDQKYQGPLCGYLDFLLPLLMKLRRLSFMPSGPVYLMLDDADNLNRTQTMILNSWVSTRSQDDVCLKISTQLRYKTYQTIAGDTIETPHDYQEVDVSTIYTSSKNVYHRRISDIIKKRLDLAKVDATPEQFFPVDAEQERQIAEIQQDITDQWTDNGRGNRLNDDVTRYARPRFIANLKGKSKSGSTYSYAGFDQLVHISSGGIRYFLHPASLMFGQERSEAKDGIVRFIRPSTQNKVIRQQADELMYKEFDKIKEDEADAEYPERTRITNINVLKLGNLIQALGGTFHLLLISDRSERRVFSIAFSDTPDEDIISVLRLGIQHGYFHESSIGNKDGTGRTRLYVLTRRLAPHFILDPSSFAGYLFVKSKDIREAMHNPNRMLRTIKDVGIDKYMNDNQLEMVFG